MMRILMIWDADYPWDVRVEKMTRSLHRNGFCVAVVCRNLKGSIISEVIDGVKFCRLPAFGKGRLNKILSFPFFLNVIWLIRIFCVARKERSQIVLVRDLPLAISAIIIGRILGLPVVVDMAENYPAMIKDTRTYGKPWWGNVLVRNVHLVKMVENYVIAKTSKIIVVTEENRNRIVERGASENDVYVVSNTPDLETYGLYKGTVDKSELAFYESKFTLIYVGGLGPIRGLEMVIEAMPQILQRIHHAYLLIIGKGEKIGILKSLAREYDIEKHVTFKGWIEFESVPQYIKASSIGIIPHRLTMHTNTTIPNKIFDYMAFGVPVVASDTAPMRRIVEGAMAGVVFEPHSPDGFAEAVVKIFEQSEIDYGKNGMAAVNNEYNWRRDEKVLLRCLRELEVCGDRADRK